MKKLLLVSLSLGLGFSMFAQNSNLKPNRPVRYVVEAERNAASTSRVQSHNPSTQAIVCDTIGRSGNAFGNYSRVSRSIIYYDPNINTITVSHRARLNPGTGFLQYDISTNGGTTWTTNIGPVYDPT